jgi:hypothetical protein
MLARKPPSLQNANSSSSWFGSSAATPVQKDEEDGETRLQYFLVAVGTDAEETQAPEQQETGRKKQNINAPLTTTTNVKPLIKIFSVTKVDDSPSQFHEKHKYHLLPNDTNTGVREVIAEDKNNNVRLLSKQSNSK